MTRRMLDASIWQSEDTASLDFAGRLLLVGMITNADDQGRGKAHPALLRSAIFPFDDVPLASITEWLRKLHESGTLIHYTIDGKSYYQLVNWWTYQSLDYAKPSDYPAPDGWQDRVRITATKGVIVTHNWLLRDGTRSPDTCDAAGKPLAAAAPDSAPANTPPATPAPGSNSPADSPDESPESAGVQSGVQSGDDSPDSTNININKNFHIHDTNVSCAAGAAQPAVAGTAPKPKRQRPKPPATPGEQPGEQPGAPPTAIPDLPDKPLTEQQQWFAALCDIAGYDHKTITAALAGQIAQTITKLKAAGYTLADIQQFMPEVWCKDWRWQKHHQTPTLTDVRNNIGKLRRDDAASAAMPAALTAANSRQWDATVLRTVDTAQEVQF